MREFLEELLRAELIAPSEVEKTQAEFDAAKLPDDLAACVAWLEKKNRLTPWQATEFLAGRRSFRCGAYELLDQLNVTLVTTIYRAQHCRTGWQAVLKILSDEMQKDEEVSARFEREIQLASQLDHPNIVTVYDAELGGPHRFLAMEYIEGSTLLAWHERYRPLPIDWVAECCRQTALGLDHAWSHGLVHRDIQPANLLVVARRLNEIPKVKIVDFGLAKTLSESYTGRNLTRQGELIGAPEYIAPEQARDARKADIRADIYSLGCVLFHMLVEQPPFPAATTLGRVLASTAQPAVRPSALRSGLDPALDDVVAKMLAVDPKDRFAEPIEVAEALEPFTGAYAPRG